MRSGIGAGCVGAGGTSPGPSRVGSGWLGMIFSGAAPDAPRQRCFDIPRHGAYRRAEIEKIPAPETGTGGVLGVI